MNKVSWGLGLELACGQFCFFWPKQITEPAQFKGWGKKDATFWWEEMQGHISRDVQTGRVGELGSFIFSIFPKVLSFKNQTAQYHVRSLHVFFTLFIGCHRPQQKTHLFFFSHFFHKLYIFFTNNLKYLLLLLKRKIFFYCDYQHKPSTFHCHHFQIAQNTL